MYWGYVQNVLALVTPGLSMFDEMVKFNATSQVHPGSRLVNECRGGIDVRTVEYLT